MSDAIINAKKFKDIDIEDDFFDSLKSSYGEFETWFIRKAEEYAYVSYDDEDNIQAFLYLKIEKGPIADIIPPLNCLECLKIGTFKINAHGTKLGERFVKIIVDTVLAHALRFAYVTIFSEYKPLISILEKYGFAEKGTKKKQNGVESVYVKDFNYISEKIELDYPLVRTAGVQKWLLSIRPGFHTNLFPDSILKTENPSMIQDASHTNAISKVYVGFMRDFPNLATGDCLIIYRCQDPNAQRNTSAWYSSVATSLCVVQEARAKSSFTNEQEFIDYCTKYSVFNEKELSNTYHKKLSFELHAIKMTYNWAFSKRPNLKTLVEHEAVPHPKHGHYMGLYKLDDDAFKKILELGGISEGIIVN